MEDLVDANAETLPFLVPQVGHHLEHGPRRRVRLAAGLLGRKTPHQALDAGGMPAMRGGERLDARVPYGP